MVGGCPPHNLRADGRCGRGGVSGPAGLARSTRRSYDQTITRLERELGDDRPLSTLSVEAVMVAVTTAWGGRAPATWNRQVATVARSWDSAAAGAGWPMTFTVDLKRRPEPADRTKTIPLPDRLGPVTAAADRPSHRWAIVPDADGQEPPRQPAVVAALCPPGC